MKLIFGLLLLSPALALGQDECSSLFQLPEQYHDGMVLQADNDIEVWGFVNPDCEGITVSRTCDEGSEDAALAVIDFGGTFAAMLPSISNGVQCSIEFQGPSLLATLEVIYGDVWICSGQSNMELQMNSITNATTEIANSAGYMNIRMYGAGDQYSDVPLDTLDPTAANWDGWYTPDNDAKLAAFSAVCFLYARELTDNVVGPDHVFGLISTNWGGTRVESWSTSDSLEPCNAPVNTGGNQNADSALYNAMIHPFIRDAIYGALWYQGESNAGYNQAIYACTFYGMIDDWRAKWANSNPDFPFGFVHLGGSIGENGVPIRWHQTNDQGTTTGSVFMALALDTYDADNGIHPTNKQIVGERLAISGGNVAYGMTDLPTNGPFPESIDIQQPVLSVQFPASPGISYDNTEISGFYVCCVPYEECDATAASPANSWTKIDQANVAAYPEDATIFVDYSFECGSDPFAVTGIAYLWESDPVKGMLAAPIYSTDEYRLPAAPWKFQLN